MDLPPRPKLWKEAESPHHDRSKVEHAKPFNHGYSPLLTRNCGTGRVEEALSSQATTTGRHSLAEPALSACPANTNYAPHLIDPQLFYSKTYQGGPIQTTLATEDKTVEK